MQREEDEYYEDNEVYTDDVMENIKIATESIVK